MMSCCGPQPPIEERIILCLAFMEREHILPMAITLKPQDYDELIFSVGNKMQRDIDGNYNIYLKLNGINILRGNNG